MKEDRIMNKLIIGLAIAVGAWFYLKKQKPAAQTQKPAADPDMMDAILNNPYAGTPGPASMEPVVTTVVEYIGGVPYGYDINPYSPNYGTLMPMIMSY